MDVTIEQLRADSRYKNATPEQQQQIEFQYTQRAWDEIKSTPEYLEADEPTRQFYKDKFTSILPYGKQIHLEEENINNSFAENMANQLGSGIQQTAESLETGVLARTGKENKLAEVVAKSYQRSSGEYIPPELKELNSIMQARTKDWQLAKGFKEKLIAATKTIYSTGEQILTNPKGSALLATQSLPNMITPIAGALGGAAVANAPGAAVGLFAGGYVAEEGAYILSALEQAVADKGLPVTQENIQKVIDDPKQFEDIMSKAMRKSAGTAGVDTALSVFGGKLVTGVLGEAKTIPRKILTRAGEALVETMSEPLSEGAGEYAAEGKIQAGELMGETIGGIASGPIMAPVATLTAGTKKVTEAIKEAKRVKPSIETSLKEKIKTPTKYKYKEEVAERIKTGKVDDISNIKNMDTYDPKMAIDVLQERNKKETKPEKQIKNIEQANKVYAELDRTRQSIIKRLNTITESKDFDPTKPNDEAKSLLKQGQAAKKLLKSIAPKIKSMEFKGADTESITKSINDIIKAEDNTTVKNAILNVLGSKANYQLTEHKDSITKVLDSPNIDNTTKDQIKKIVAYQDTVDSLPEKSLGQVHEDVINGTPGYLGSNQYMQLISTAVKNKDIITAKSKLQALRKFANAHNIKAKVFRAVHEHLVNEAPISQDTINKFNGYQSKREKPLNLGPNAARLVSTIEQEAEALNQAVSASESLIQLTATDSSNINGDSTIETEVTTGERTKAKEPVVTSDEGSLPIDTLVEEVGNKELNKQLIDAGINPKQLNKLNTKDKQIALKYTNLDKQQIQDVAEDLDINSRERNIARLVYKAKTTKESIQTKSVAPKKETISTEQQEKLKSKYNDLTVEQLKNVAEDLDEGPEKDIARSVYREKIDKIPPQERLLTKDTNDTTNIYKNTFEPKQIKGILNNTSDINQALEDHSVFNENHPLDDDAKNVITAIKKFATKFTKAFTDSYAPYVSQSSIDNFDLNMIQRRVRNLPKALGYTAKQKNKYFELLKTKLPNKVTITTDELLKAIDQVYPNSKIAKAFKDKIEGYKTTIQDHRIDNPLQYLESNGAIPQQVINALIAVSYKWLSTKAQSTLYSTEDQMKQTLGLKESDYISDTAKDLLSTLGVHKNLLLEELGKEAFKLLGIKPTKEADYDAQNRLELALGNQAIAVMQTMGLITQKDVTKEGYDQLLQGRAVDEHNFFRNPKDYKQIKDKGYISFYRVNAPNGVIDSYVRDELINTFNKSKHTWDLLFKGEPNKLSYTFNAEDLSAPKVAKGTNFKISDKQSNITDKQQRRDYVASARTMNLYLLLGDKLRDTLLGKQDPALTHIVNNKTAKGKNLSIDMAHQHVIDWLFNAAKQPNGFESTFNIPQEVWRMGRMGQAGEINPQGDKSHRMLFNMSDWNVTHDLTKETDKVNFLGAVAFGLDIEFLKVGGVNNALALTQEKLNKPIFVKAIQSLNTLMDEHGEFDKLIPQGMEQLSEHVQDQLTPVVEASIAAGSDPMHAFKTLIEYTRFIRAINRNDKSFTSDLTTEIDGTSNGVIIARTQLTADNADIAATIYTLQNGGYAFSKNAPTLSEHMQKKLSLDSYEVTGSALQDQLTKIESNLNKQLQKDPNNKALNIRAKQLQASKNIFGDFRAKDGTVSGTIRKLAKDPTMRTIYGMGKLSLIKEFQDSFIKSIYSKLEQIAKLNQSGKTAAEAHQKLKTLNSNITALTGHTLFKDVDTADTNTILTTKLTDQDIEIINKHIEEFYGVALDNAINQVYGSLKATFKPLNKGVQIAASFYNAMLKLKTIEAEQKAGNRKLTVGEIKSIEQGIQKLYPAVKTLLGNKIPLARKNNQKEYGSKEDLSGRVVIQSFKNMPLKRANPFTISGIQNPGVGAPILSIHNQDSITALNVMDLFPMLNNHDGFTIGIDKAQALGVAANKSHYETMYNYDMAMELYKSTNRIQKEFIKMLKDVNLSNKIINNTIVTELNANGFKVNTSNSFNTVSTALDEMKSIGIQTAFNKKSILDAVIGVEQYFYPNSRYETNNSVKTITIGSKTLTPETAITTAEQKLKTKMESADSIGEIIVNTVINDPINSDTKQAINNNKIDQVKAEPKQKNFNPQIDEKLGSRKKQLILIQGFESKQPIKLMGTFYDYDGVKLGIVKEKRLWKLYELSTGLALTTPDMFTKKDLLEYLHNSKTYTPENIKERLNAFGSIPTATNLSIDPNEYEIRRTVDQMNVTDIYDVIKDDSTVIDSDEHSNYLKSLLTTIAQKVMNPIDVYLKNNPDIETEGLFLPTKDGKDRIFISNQNRIIGPVSGALMQGIRMSTGEVYTHEIMHSILYYGLNHKNNELIRNKVKRLFKLAKRELGKDGYKAFLNDPTNLSDPFEVQAAKDRYNYIFNNTKTISAHVFENDINPATKIKSDYKQSNYLDEFLTHGITNRNFMNALSNISITKGFYDRQIKGKNVQETLGNIGQYIMDFFYKKFSSRSTVDKELQHLAVLLAKKDSDHKGALFTKLTQASQLYSNGLQYANDFVKKNVQKLPIIKTIKGLKYLVKHIKETDTILGQRLRETEYAYQNIDNGITKSLIKEMSGRTDRMAWLHSMLNRKQVWLNQAKQAEQETYTNLANDLFQSPLEEHDKISVTKSILKTDLSALKDHMNMDQIRGILASSKKRNAKIQGILKELQNDPILSPYVEYYRMASDALGYHMATGRSRGGEIAWQSVKVIASLKNTKHHLALTEAQISKAETYIDQLATLYAVKYTPKNYTNTVIQLIDKDKSGVIGVMQMHEVLKERALREIFNNNRYQFIKGYTKQILNPRVDVQYGTIEDKAELNRAGYTMVDNPIGSDPDYPTKPFYVFVSRSGRINNLLAGIFSYTANKAKGTSFERIAAKTDTTAFKNTLMKRKQQIIDNMVNGNTPTYEEGHFMIPKVDVNGNVIDYRYMMSEQTKDSFFEQSNDYAKILGSMASQIVDKVRSPKINQELIYGLKAVYDEEYQNNPNGFVEISTASDDPRLRDIAELLPAKAKKDIKKIWKGNPISIPKDFVDIAFGYREFSIKEPFAKDPIDRNRLEKMVVGISEMLFKPFGGKAAERLSSVETLFLEATKIAKNNIIVKSLHVTLGNLGSNLIYLKSKGIPVTTIIKLGWEAVAMGNKYQIDKKQLDTFKLKRKMLLKGSYTAAQLDVIDNKIAVLEDAIYRNPTTITIESGLMPSLVDDVETVTSDIEFPTDFEKSINTFTNKLPKTVQNVGKVVLLTEDTTAYKMLNNAVKMTDFVGRHILYNYYTKQGMGHKEAVEKCIDEFINFDVPTHRMIDWGNRIGFLWFTKYSTRILKVVKDSIMDKPIDVFMAYMLSTHIGFDNILNSVPNSMRDTFKIFGNPISASVNSMDELMTVQAASILF